MDEAQKFQKMDRYLESKQEFEEVSAQITATRVRLSQAMMEEAVAMDQRSWIDLGPQAWVTLLVLGNLPLTAGSSPGLAYPAPPDPKRRTQDGATRCS